MDTNKISKEKSMVEIQGSSSVIIKRESLERFEKGTSERFIKENNISKKYFDDKIISVLVSTKMYQAEIYEDEEKYKQELRDKYKLIFWDCFKNSKDFAIVDMYGIYLNTCDWLKCVDKGKYEYVENGIDKQLSKNYADFIFEYLPLKLILNKYLIDNEDFVKDLDSIDGFCRKLQNKFHNEKMEELNFIIGNTARTFILKVIVLKHLQKILLSQKDNFLDIYWKDKAKYFLDENN